MHISLEVLEHVRTATMHPMRTAQGPGGAPFCPDADSIDPCTQADDDHRTVNHGAGEYARRASDGTWVPCNTMEGRWASAIFWTASRGAANVACTSASHATSACTTMDTCTGVRPSKQPCGTFSRPRVIICGGWSTNIAVCR